MTIKINVGVNKKIGLPDYGSAGSHCNIEIEADNSILDNADQFLQRVKGVIVWRTLWSYFFSLCCYKGLQT